MTSYLSNLFWDPDPFEGDPYGFGVNQVLHFIIARYGALLIFDWWIIITLAVAWESAQVAFAKAPIYDKFEDLTFFVTGALSVIWEPMILVSLLPLAAGTTRRLGI